MGAWDFNRNLIKGHFAWKKEIYLLGIKMPEENESFCVNRNVLYLDWDASYAGVYICQTSLTCALKMNVQGTIKQYGESLNFKKKLQ